MRADGARLALRAGLAWAGLTLLVSLWGAQALVAAGPAVQGIVEWMLPGFITTVRLNPRRATSYTGGAGDVHMELQAHTPVQVSGTLGVQPWVKLTQSITAGHDLVCAILFFTVLIAWPFHSWRQRLEAFAIGVPLCAALTLWLVSVHFAGLFEIALQDMAAQHGLHRAPRFVLTQFLFNEGGGNWLAALLAALVVVMFVERGGRPRRGATPNPALPASTPSPRAATAA